MSTLDSGLSGSAAPGSGLSGSAASSSGLSGSALPPAPAGGAGPEAAADGVPETTPAGRPDHGFIDHRRERIRVQTATHRIEGNVTLARDGFRSRVSDMLNASERDFLTLTDATVTPIAGGPNERHGFLAVARRHIVFAVLADDGEAQPS